MLSICIQKFTTTEFHGTLSVDKLIRKTEFSAYIALDSRKDTNNVFFNRLVLIEIDTELNALSNKTILKLKQYRYAKLSTGYVMILTMMTT